MHIPTGIKLHVGTHIQRRYMYMSYAHTKRYRMRFFLFNRTLLLDCETELR